MSAILPLTYTSGKCFYNAYINKRNFYKDRNLKLVFGSVSFNGFFEFGGETWGLKEFEARHIKGSHVWDAHAWLEDEDGNIYDKIFPFYNYSAKVNTGSELKVASETVWEGISPYQAKKQGVVYVKADKETQTAIFLSLLPFYKANDGSAPPLWSKKPSISKRK
jgi:hypothetical protein